MKSLLCLVSTFLLAANAFGQCSNGHCVPVQAVEVIQREIPVAYPVPFTVAVPVVSYLYQGASYAPVYSAQLANPAAPIQTQYGKAPATISLSEEQIEQIVSKLEARLKNGNNGSHSKPKLDPPPPVPANPSRGELVSILSRPLGNDKRSCADCHTGSNSKKGVRIFDSPGVLNLHADWFAIWDMAERGDMPPEARINRDAILTDHEVEVLRQKVRDAHKARR